MGTYDQVPQQEVTILNDSSSKYLIYDNTMSFNIKNLLLDPSFYSEDTYHGTGLICHQL